MKKRKNTSHSGNGIMVCDSIVMSVKKKRFNMRKIEAVTIGLAGYIAAIMVFLNMFSFKYNRLDLTLAAMLFSLVYITLSLIGKKAIWIITATAAGAMMLSYKFIEIIAFGYKFTYNVIYKASYHTEICYYKFLDTSKEEHCTTIFFIFCAWLLAVLIYLFTIYHPNAIPPLLVTFPILEVGLYNGIKVSIFWGMLLVSYWIALLAMTTLDMGEYSGGTGGFVRKENLFFPKRQMRLKVTEKCGIYIMISIMAVSGITTCVMKATDYHRSDEINEKRIGIRDAVSSFTIDDISGSISNVTNALGFALKVETHKLGRVDRLRYKNTTDLIVDISHKIDGAVYLKEYNGAVYDNNEWTQLPSSAYSSEVFRDFEKYSVHPQDFGGIFFNPIRMNLYSLMLDDNNNIYTIDIESKLKGNRSFAPYYTFAQGIKNYDRDATLTSKSNGNNKYSYTFGRIETDSISRILDPSSRSTYRIGDVENEDARKRLEKYCEDKKLSDGSGYLFVDTEMKSNVNVAYSFDDMILAEMIQEDYEKFVYDHYLQLPDNENMDEVRAMFSDILDTSSPDDIAEKQLKTLEAIRLRIAMNAEYSLDPGRTPNNRDFVNYFLTENKKGYCMHYATSGIVLARMAGIPARFASGYVIVGNDFNDSNMEVGGNYKIKVKDNRSHAWAEVYLKGFGWVPFEFTAGYSEQSIDTTPATTASTTTVTTTTTTADETDTDTTTSTKDHSTEDTTTSVITTVTTTVASTVPVAVKTGIPAAFKQVFRVILAAAAIAVIFILRRRLIIALRKKRFNSGSASERMAHIYTYSEKMLSYYGSKRGDTGYSEYADSIEEKLGGALFGAGSFRALMNDALRAAFSSEVPSVDELKRHMKFNNELARKIYTRAGRIEKIYLKYVLVLVD